MKYEMTNQNDDVKCSLTPRQRRFAELYAESLNASRAAREAGYSRKGAKEEGARLLANANVRAAVRQHQKQLAEASFVEAVHVIRELAAIAFADHNELSQLRRESCRHCYGLNHFYQWIDAEEFGAAVARFRRELLELPAEDRLAAEEGKPECLGGFGFDPRREPHPECPRCRGEGIPSVWFADTTRLSPMAQRLYAGTKRTRDGVQIMTRDQDKALELLGRHLGMFNDKLQLKNDPENPIALLVAQVQGTAFKPIANPIEDTE